MKKNNEQIKIRARKEVILSAGAINTPQILMLPGIGPADHLVRFDIDVIANLPVGKTFYDHIYSSIIFYTLEKSEENFTETTESR